MEYYLPLKYLHILSSTILFGTGLGTAFLMWRADKSGDLATIAMTSRHVVLADWVFTVPAVIVQPVTGLAMVFVSGASLSTAWLAYSVGLYLVVGLCWLPVVWIQIRVARRANAALQEGGVLNDSYRRVMRWWYALGWPAFIMVMFIFYLMVFKPI